MVNESNQTQASVFKRQPWDSPELQELSVGRLTEAAMGPFTDGATMGNTEQETPAS